MIAATSSPVTGDDLADLLGAFVRGISERAIRESAVVGKPYDGLFLDGPLGLASNGDHCRDSVRFCDPRVLGPALRMDERR